MREEDEDEKCGSEDGMDDNDEDDEDNDDDSVEGIVPEEGQIPAGILGSQASAA